MIPIVLSEQELRDLISALVVARINCRDEDEAGIAKLLRKTQAIAAAYKVKP